MEKIRFDTNDTIDQDCLTPCPHCSGTMVGSVACTTCRYHVDRNYYEVTCSKTEETAVAASQRVGILAFELGYRACEKGQNLQAALEEFNKTMEGGSHES